MMGTPGNRNEGGRFAEAHAPRVRTRRLRLHFYPLAQKVMDLLYAYLSPKAVLLDPQPVPLHPPNPQLFEIVPEPESADFIIFPFDLSMLLFRYGIKGGIPTHDPDRDDPRGGEHLERFFRDFPFLSGLERRHVFFSNHDYHGPFPTGALIFCTSADRRHPNTVALPYQAKDLGLLMDFHRVQYHTSFMGWLGSHGVRPALVMALVDYAGSHDDLSIFLDGADQFHGHWSEEGRRVERRLRFLDAMRKSLTVLCPRGAGLNSVRFYETLSMGRIPILVSDHCTLPLEDCIDWNSSILRIPEGEVRDAGSILAQWLHHQSMEEIIRKCRRNRVIWQRHLNPSTLQHLIADRLWKALEG